MGQVRTDARIPVEDRRAIPQVLKSSSHKPEAVHVVRRRFRTLTTNTNEYQSGNTVIIPIDTATHGSFMDPKSTQLEFDLKISNNNPYVDFQNFPRCGANIVFQEMRVRCAGNPVEENLNYAESFELDMLGKNMNGHIWEMFKSNRYYENFGFTPHQHMNLVKPCMVDWMGAPMYSGQRSGYSSSWQYLRPKNDVTHAHLHEAVYDQRHSNWDNLRIDSTSPTVVLRSNAVDRAAGVAVGDIYIDIDTPVSTGLRAGDIVRPTGGTELLLVTNKTVAGDQITVVRGFLNTTPAFIADNVVLLHVGNATPSEENVEISAANWPINQPYFIGACDGERAGAGRVQDYAAFLTNTRAFPIGVKPVLVDGDYTNHVPTATLPYEKSVISYHVSTEILSGLLGTMAEKYFPSLLIAPNKLALEFKLATKEKALWFSMDPCRRIPRIRDYLPYKRQLHQHVLDDTDVNFHYGLGCTPNTVHPLLFQRDFTGAQVHAVDILGKEICVSPYVACGLSPYKFGDVPMPQYCLAVQNELYNKDSVAVSYIKETEGCYGTWRRSSMAQTRRTHTGALPMDAYNHSGISGRAEDVDYSITNVEFVGEEVLLPDIVTATLLQEANSGEIGMHTEMIRTYNTTCLTGETQQIQVPVRVVQASKVSFVFRHPHALQGSSANNYNSLSFINPFTLVEHTPSIHHEISGYYTVDSALDSNAKRGINLRMNLGNTQYPQQPIQSLVELMKENDKAMHIKQNCMQATAARVQSSFSSNLSTKGIDYSVFEDQGFLTPHVPIELLDDQTLTGNPYMIFPGVANISARRTTTSPGLAMAPVGTFHISFDLDSFQNSSDVMRSGSPIVNHQLVLQFQNAKGMSKIGLRCDVIIHHSARASFQSGGEMRVIY